MSRFIFGKLLLVALLAVVTTSSIFAAESISVAHKSYSTSMNHARKPLQTKKRINWSDRRTAARGAAHARARTQVKHTRKCSRRKHCSY
jgi:hypothetical protein